MDRLVELFLESARPEGEAAAGLPPFSSTDGVPDDEAIEKGMTVVVKMMTSDDAIQMGGSPSATFVVLAMALEEKQKLAGASIRCYEMALQFLGRRTKENGGGWERAVVLQQLGAVGLRQGRFEESKSWLKDCVEVCKTSPGHPRDADLFGGAFNTKQTRMEFAATLEKMRAQVCGRMGDKEQAYIHLAESQRLEQIAGGDAVERQLLKQEASDNKATAQAKPTESLAPAATGNTPKELWAERPMETRRLKEYRYADEGSTVSIILELNEHLGIGAEASEAVQALQQFRVKCEPDSVDVQLRLRRLDGKVWHFHLVMSPLCKEIVPEDTVPRLRGKEGRRRLEIKLFKRDKDKTWYGDIVGEPKKPEAKKVKAAEAAAAAAKGTLMNPLTPEELARLPTPGGGTCDNRPSTWQQDSRVAGTSALARTAPEAGAAVVSAPLDTDDPPPAWVACIEERPCASEGGGFEILVHLGEAAGEPVTMQDLELDADAASGVLRLHHLHGGGRLELRPPAGTSLDGLAPKWRKKTRVLELRFPPQA